jgi:phage terminase large subunit
LKYRYLSDTSNETFLPLFFDASRYLVLKGGGGSGKSIFAGRKVLERVTTEDNHRFLICRKVGKTLRDSCFRQLVSQLNETYPHVTYRANKTDMRIYIEDTESEIIFVGLDDVEKLKSIFNITGMWLEEASELLESDFNQLDIRLRGETPYYKQIILTFNPISAVHWLKARFFDQKPDNCTTHESNYHDNRFLDEEAKEVLEGFREIDEYYYTVYCLGEWGVTGKTVFPGKLVSERLQLIKTPFKTGFFTYDTDGQKISSFHFVEEEVGPIRIYREPEKGKPYVIGGDPAGDGSDHHILQCIDNINMTQCAVFNRSKIDEDEYAAQAYCLGMYYNKALLAIESNWSTYPIMELERLSYPKQYVRESFDTYTHAVKTSFGFRTDAKTRPVIIANLIKAVREDISFINDRATLEEMLTFVRTDSLRAEAEEGAHDDCIMALAIALFARDQQRMYIEHTEESAKWTESMIEDFDNASPEERAYLMKKWGRPQ